MKRVVVIGANRGLGLEFARRYGAAGPGVVATELHGSFFNHDGERIAW